jgi:hypothetical protein
VRVVIAMIGALFGLVFYVLGLVVGLVNGTVGLAFYVVFGLAGFVLSWLDIYFCWYAALLMLYWVEYIGTSCNPPPAHSAATRIFLIRFIFCSIN